MSRRRASARRLAALLALPVLLACLPGWPAERIGSVVAVRPEATVAPAGEAPRALGIGRPVAMQEKFRTGARGRIELLFRDGSTIAIGPDSELTLDHFVYDSRAAAGELAVTVAKGVFRFIGGRISKTRPVRFHTPMAVIGIRGGMALLQVGASEQQPEVRATFLYGEELVVENGGLRQRTTRPGFTVLAGRNGSLAPPSRALQQALDDVARSLQ